MTTTGTHTAGGPFRIPLIVVFGLEARQDFFAPERREEAESRFRELVAESSLSSQSRA